MSQTPQQQGTTLAILQAYPLGTLAVETPYGPGRLTGLRFDARHGCMVGDVQDIMLVVGGAVCDLAALKPHLKGFSALTEPLEDGTVPAVEVAKIILRSQHDVTYHRYDAASVRARENKLGNKWVEVSVPGRYDSLEIAIYSDFDLENEDRGLYISDILGVLAYLRSQHFAVGLEPHQYIAKSSARPTKEEGGKP